MAPLPQRPDNGHAAITVFLLLLIACALTGGCLDSITIPDFGGFTLPIPPQGSEGNLRVYFLDVGQGDSSVILFGNKTILIDAGEIDMGDRVVDDLRQLGVTRIDLLVATHPHSDHIGGMENVFDAFSVGEVLDSGMPHTSPLYEKFLETIDERNIQYTIAEQGQTPNLDPALRILVLSPPEKRFGDDLNENSVVLRISYGTVDFLFMGDAGKEAEGALAKTGYALDAEIVKIGHHGSSSSTGAAFLSRVHPEVAVISLGAGNPYGHPHAGTLAALKDAEVTVYRTDRDGTILINSDGSSYSIKTAQGTGGVFTQTPSIRQNISLIATPVITHAATLPVRICATQFNAPGDDRVNLNGEYIVLANQGDDPVLLAGWTLSDKSGSALYTFPAFILLPDASVTVYTGAGSINDTALFMEKTVPVWGNNGDEAVLKDAQGSVIDRKTEGAQG
jgi:beta-lactamase superfamily II metal-dependent hydrolase